MTHFPVIATFYKMGVGIGPFVSSIDGLVAPFWLAANYNAGDSVSWRESRRDSFCCQFSFPAFRRLAL